MRMEIPRADGSGSINVEVGKQAYAVYNNYGRLVRTYQRSGDAHRRALKECGAVLPVTLSPS